MQQRIKELTDLLNKASYAYYTQSDSFMSDRDFDMYLKELEGLERAHPQWVEKDSPTKRVGSDLTPGFEKVVHKVPMLSIDNVFSLEETQGYLNGVYKQLQDTAGDIIFTAELKIDGVSLSLYYSQGKLVRAVTRGDGIKGDDVTENARTILDVPLEIAYQEDLEVRGECFMDKKVFKAINASCEETGGSTYKNARNLTSGTLKTKNVQEVARRNLRFKAFGIATDVPEVTTQIEVVNFLKGLGFPNVNPAIVLEGLDHFKEFREKIGSAREAGQLPFDIDGIVLKVNSLGLRETLWHTGKHVRWAIAYKFASDQVKTKLISVIYQTGRTGKVTPVAILEPVDLMGSTVQRATLHNNDEIARLSLCEGDMVFLEKGGDIIPKIVKVDESAREGEMVPIAILGTCPSCGAPLVKKSTEQVDMFCSNTQDCPAQTQGRLEYFVSRTCMNILSLGGSMLEKLIANGSVKEPLDLYDLVPRHFIGIPGVGSKSISKVLDNIDDSRKLPPPNLLAGLGVPLIGKETSVKVMTQFGGWVGLWNALENDIARVEGVGEKAASNFAAWRVANPGFLDRIIELGMTMEYKPIINKGGSLFGKDMVVTGTLSTLKREEAQELIEKNGGIFRKGVTKKTNVLIVGADAGATKMAKAEKAGIEIWTEMMFLEKIGN